MEQAPQTVLTLKSRALARPLPAVHAHVRSQGAGLR